MSRLNIPTPDATTTATGKIELAGSLGGTATSPTVVTNANLTGDVTSSGNATTIGAAKVKPGMLATGGAAALVATSESTSSTTYVSLTTTTDAVTVTIGANGLALVNIYANMSNSVASSHVHVSFAISGASTVAAVDGFDLEYITPPSGAAFNDARGTTFLVTGLAAGSTTFAMKYRVNSSTGTFSNRRISVVPL